MSKKLYVFAIGGTGSRVLRSLTMLLASGVRLPGEFKTVVPIIIDPDSANGDMNRTSDLLLKYQHIRHEVGADLNFFNTSIKTLVSLTEENVPPIADHFLFNISGTNKDTFEDFIDYQGLDAVNQSLLDLLYTKSELKSDMNVGFKGRPNIGSIVLNQIVQSREFHEFADKFDQGDAIFIISSIFGGTGAAGFPLLLKNLRADNQSIPNAHLIRESTIGAITYLPYFKISPPNDKKDLTIDHNTFLGKAQAALSYYEHAIFNNKSLNAFYYTSDFSQNNYEHNDGKENQRNNAHFLELAGALAIMDFLEDQPNLQTKNSKALNPTSKEFGIKNDTRSIDFDALGKESYEKLCVNLSKMALMEKFLRKGLDKNLNSNTTWVKDGGFTKEDFFNKNFYKRNFIEFLKSFNSWLEEMKNNDVSFWPIHDSQNLDELLNFINGQERGNSKILAKLGSKKSSYKQVIKELNTNFKKLESKDSKERQFVRLFDQATESVVTSILN